MGVGISADLPSIRPSPFKGEGAGDAEPQPLTVPMKQNNIVYAPLRSLSGVPLSSVELQFAIPHSALL